MLHHIDGIFSLTSPCIRFAFTKLYGLLDAKVMFMCLDAMLMGTSPGTRRDSSSFATLSTTSVIVLGPITDAYNQYNTPALSSPFLAK